MLSDMGFIGTYYKPVAIIVMLIATMYCDEPHNTTRIDRDWENISELTPYYFSNYTSAKEIYLQKNVINHVSYRAFTGAPVEFLLLSYNRLTCVPNLTSIHRTLRTISLSHNRINICSDNVRYQKTFGNLRYIGLGYNLLTSIPSIVLATVALTDLNLQKNQLTVVPDLRDVVPSLFVGMHRLNLQDNPLLCDCSAHWIKEEELHRGWPMMFHKYICPDRKFPKPHIWNDLSLINFAHCTFYSKGGK